MCIRDRHHSSGQLSKLFKSLDPISGKKRGRPKTFGVLDVIQRCTGLFGDSIVDVGANVGVLPEGLSPEVIGYESDLMAALLNIIDNALHWLGTSPVRPRELSFSISQSKKYVRIAVSNNGPMIDERFRMSLFNPGFSLKTEGSGIGLAIAREAMRASKGDVAFDHDSDQTTFVIEMLRAQTK